MITTTPDAQVERCGVQTSASFTIKASSKAFAVLSSGLYSDKPLAVVREILCNCWDAHVAACNPVPPLVHLPNNFEPYLSFRDFGTGLSNEQMLTLYTTYFDSSKTQSNDFTGCLGLGSKSPFCYVDSFTVISYYNGTKRTYTAFLNERNMPDIALMNTEVTTEHNGLDVQIPVKANDYREFRMKLQTVAKRFKVKPEVVGNTSYSCPPLNYTLQGNGWSLRSDDGEEAVAVMGNVAYPIDLTHDSLTPAERAALRLPVDLDFNIGQLDIAASREKLSFDAPTIANIRTRLNTMIAEVADIVSKKLASAKNLWEARCTALDVVHGEYSVFHNLIQESVPLKWKGHVLSTLKELPIKCKAIVSRYSNDYESTRRRRRTHSFSVDSLVVKRNLVVYLDDLPRGSQLRAKYAVRTGKQEVITLTPIAKPDGYDKPDALTQQLPPPWPTVQDQLQEFLNILGIDDSYVQKLSSLPRPPRVGGYVNPKSKARMVRYQPQTNPGYAAESYNWEAESIDLNKGGVYVVIDRYMVRKKRGGEGTGATVIDALRKSMDAAGLNIDSVPIYGIKRGYADKLIGLPQWKLLYDFCSEKINDKLAQNLQRISDSYHIIAFNGGATMRIGSLMQSLNDVDTAKPFGAFLARYQAFSVNAGNAARWTALEEAAKEYATPSSLPAPSDDLDKAYNEMLKSYPMLSLMAETIASKTGKYVTEITEYVKLVDSK